MNKHPPPHPPVPDAPPRVSGNSLNCFLQMLAPHLRTSSEPVQLIEDTLPHASFFSFYETMKLLQDLVVLPLSCRNETKLPRLFFCFVLNSVRREDMSAALKALTNNARGLNERLLEAAGVAS